MIRFKCGKCAKILNLDDAKAGKVVACPCGQKLRVPMPKGTPAAKTGAAKKPGDKTAAKTAAPEKAKKKVHEDDDFDPYTMQPLSEPPPPIEINRGSAEEDDEEDGGKSRRAAAKKKSKGRTKGDYEKGKRGVIVIIGVLMAIELIGVIGLLIQPPGAAAEDIIKQLPPEMVEAFKKSMEQQKVQAPITVFVGFAISAGLCTALYFGQNWSRIVLAIRLLLGSCGALVGVILIAAFAKIVGVQGFGMTIFYGAAVMIVYTIIAIRLLISGAIKTYTGA